MGIEAGRDRLGPEIVLYYGTHGTNEREPGRYAQHAHCLAHAVTSIHPPGSWILAPGSSLITDHWRFKKW